MWMSLLTILHHGFRFPSSADLHVRQVRVSQLGKVLLLRRSCRIVGRKAHKMLRGSKETVFQAKARAHEWTLVDGLGLFSTDIELTSSKALFARGV